MIDAYIALIARETGWTIEYIRALPVYQFYALAEEFQFLRDKERYQQAHNAALIICTLASSKQKRYKPTDIIGQPPERRVNMKKKIFKTPTVHKLKLLDGNEYTLPVLDVNLMADLEEDFDKSLEEVSTLLQTRTNSALRRLLHIMLRKDYPDMTPENIGKLVNLTNLEEVATTVGKVLAGE